jgi:hypothetical protein
MPERQPEASPSPRARLALRKPDIEPKEDVGLRDVI